VAIVDLMIEPGKVKQPMENQHAQLRRQRMTLLAGLTPGRVHTDGDVAIEFFLLFDDWICRKRKHVRRFVLAAILAIEPANFSIRGNQYAYIAAQAKGTSRL
jgi:hypothetical protein